MKAKHKLLISAVLLISTQTLLVQSASSQIVSSNPFTADQVLDGNGVDLTTGKLRFDFSIDIGSQASGLSYLRTYYDGRYFDNLMGNISIKNSQYLVQIGADTEEFTKSGEDYISARKNGSTLLKDGASYIYARSDGTRAIFNEWLNLTLLIMPSGEQQSFSYESANVVIDISPTGQRTYGTVRRLKSLSNSKGWKLVPTYQHNNPGYGNIEDWQHLTKATLVSDFSSCNSAYCKQPSVNISQRSSLPVTITDSLGRVTELVFENNQIKSIKSGEDTQPSRAFEYTNNRISKVIADGLEYYYTYEDLGQQRKVTVQRSGLTAKQYYFSNTNNNLIKIIDELGASSVNTYDDGGRLLTAQSHEGDISTFTYDERGNELTATYNPKTGSSVSALKKTSIYPATCTNPITCNRPISVTGTDGITFFYEYDPTHGGVTSEIETGRDGTPTKNTKYIYQRLNVLGQSDQAGTWMLYKVVKCVETVDCDAPDKQIVTTNQYSTNLLPTSVATTNGINGETTSITMTYDPIGNVKTIDGPFPGSTDTTRFYYDYGRQKIGVVGPDPDGTGSMLRRVTRYIYNLDGNVTAELQGTASSQNDTAMYIAGASIVFATTNSYDSFGRLASISTISNYGLPSESLTSLQNLSYDKWGRVNCIATRMNTQSFSSYPAACLLGTEGSMGPDRITKFSYDALDRITSKTEAAGTLAERTEYTEYTSGGNVASIVDGEGNKTKFEYDGHNRLKKTVYPNTSFNDYEEISYDQYGNIVSKRLRDGAFLNFTLNSSNRISQVISPLSNSTNSSSVHISYAYDSFGRLKEAFDNKSGNSIKLSYDPFGRTIEEDYGFNGKIRSEYDSRGYRTKTIWQDGNFVSYTYLLTGELASIKENGTISLANFVYDNAGRRTTITRGNGTSSSYTYSNNGPLSSITHDLQGATWDTTINTTRNIENQVIERTMSNDLYNWSNYPVVSRSYTSNSLNQLKKSGQLEIGYDNRGNLVSSDVNTWSYDNRNLLNSYNGNKVSYDSLGRIFSIAPSGVMFLRSGDQLSVELDANGGIVRRYVWGVQDEPLIWYEGASLSEKRWLIADDRKNVIAITNQAGAALAVNKYDEYGIPASTNMGRFQFSGQMWLNEIGLYDAKARLYSPTLGRFMQVDPVGLADGLNLYNYVGSDPINLQDSSGTTAETIVYGTRTQPYDSGGMGLITTPPSSGVYNPAPGSSNLGGVSNGTITVTGKRPSKPKSSNSSESLVVNEQDIVVYCDLRCMGRVAREKYRELRRITREAALAARRAAQAYKMAQREARRLLRQNPAKTLVDFVVNEACCFAAGTLVHTRTGQVRIEDLKIGDKVLSRNPVTLQTEEKPVVNLTSLHDREEWRVEIKANKDIKSDVVESFSTTHDHPWRLEKGNWLSSSELRPGDRVVTLSGIAIVEKSYGLGNIIPTFNIEVAEFSTYFVGNVGAWVHNACLSSAYKMNRLYYSGRAPKGIGRTDSPRVPFEKQHTIIEGVGHLNYDGTWKHYYGGEITKAQANFLREHGYQIP